MTTDLKTHVAILNVLKYHAGGYYFRSKALGQLRIMPKFQAEAVAMGFVCKPVKIKRTVTARVWINPNFVMPSHAERKAMDKLLGKPEYYVTLA